MTPSLYARTMTTFFQCNKLDEVVMTFLSRVISETGIKSQNKSTTDQIKLISVCVSLRQVVAAVIGRKYSARVNEEFLEYVDENIRGYFRSWAQNMGQLIAPRPANLGSIEAAGSFQEFYVDYRKSLHILTSIPQTDLILYRCLGNNHSAAYDRLVDFLIGYLHEIKCQHFLRKDPRFLLKSSIDVILSSYLRLRRLVAFSVLFVERIGVKSKMWTEDEKTIAALIDHLKETFSIVSTFDGTTVFESQSLVEDPARRQAFRYTSTDMPMCFEDDFQLSIRRIAEGYEIIVEGRNAWKKFLWVNKLCKAFSLRLMEQSYCDDFELTQWRDKIPFRCEAALICMLYSLQLLTSEVQCVEDPTFLIGLYNYICQFLFGSHTLFGPSILSKNLWTVCSNICSQWISEIARYCTAGVIDSQDGWILPALDTCNKIMNRCPFSSAVNYSSIQRSIEDLLKCHNLQKKSPDHAYYLFYLRSTLKRCINQGKIITCPNDELSHIQLLGSGAFGDVFRCFDPQLHKTVALKEIRLTGNEGQQISEQVVQEASYLSFLVHGNILTYYSVDFLPDRILLKTDYCSGGSLKKKIETNGLYGPKLFRMAALCILQGLFFLHSNKIIHGDLKPSNVLIDRCGHMRLADFGAAQQLAKCTSKQQISSLTIQYSAPEVIMSGQCTLSSDIWSYGCVLFYMATGVAPWYNYDNFTRIIWKIGCGQIFDLTPLEAVEPKMKKLILSCLKINPDERPTAALLLFNDYLFDG